MLRFGKDGPAKYLGHLDVMRCFQRAARRADVPLAYSQGFNPRPRLMFASPLPVGASGLGELVALDLATDMPPEMVVDALNGALPEGLRAFEAWRVPAGRGTFGTVIRSEWAVDLVFDASPEGGLLPALEAALNGMLEAQTFTTRRRDGRVKEIRRCILGLSAGQVHGLEASLVMILLQDGDLSARPQDVVQALCETVGPAVPVGMCRRSMTVDIGMAGRSPRAGGVKTGEEGR